MFNPWSKKESRDRLKCLPSSYGIFKYDLFVSTCTCSVIIRLMYNCMRSSLNDKYYWFSCQNTFDNWQANMIVCCQDVSIYCWYELIEKQWRNILYKQKYISKIMYIWLIDCIELNAVSAIFQPYNEAFFFRNKSIYFCYISQCL